jgi:hypothetical protein
MRTPRGLTTAIALTGLLVVGCTGDDPAPTETGAATAPVPEGWTTYEGDGVTFAHPSDWQVRDESDDRVDVVGPEGGDFAPIVSVRWGPPQGMAPSDSLDVVAANLVNTLPDVEPGEIEPLEVAGSIDGATRRVEYTQPLEDGEIPVVEIQAKVLGEQVEVLVRAAHRADEFDQVEDVFEDIVASLDVTATEEAGTA